VVNPFRRLEVNGKNVDSALTEAGPGYTTAVGLALRALGDTYPGFNLLFASDKPNYKKRNYAGLRTIVPVVAFSALIFVMGLIYMAQNNTLTSLNHKLAAIRKETDLYRDKISMVEDLNRKRADIAARIDVITDLDKNRFARIKVLQLLSDNLPELTWLTGVQEIGTEHGAGLSVTGISSSNLKVSQYMTNLLRSKDVKGVDLQVSEQTEISGSSVTRFTLQIALPGLGLAAPPVAKPTDELKRGAQAVKDQRAAQAKAMKDAGK
jgi:type IV pilus assembly protein PilN